MARPERLVRVVTTPTKAVPAGVALPVGPAPGHADPSRDPPKGRAFRRSSVAGLTADDFAATTGKADLRRSGAPPQGALPPNPRPALAFGIIRQPNTSGGRPENRLCRSGHGESSTSQVRSVDRGLGGEPIGEPTHEYGMDKPRRSLGLITLAATTTGPLRSGP